MSRASPQWSAEYLKWKHRERLRKDPGCFEDLLGLPAGKEMTPTQYEDRSLEAVEHAWAEYEGDHKDRATGEYCGMRAYFVDNDLVVAVTDTFRHDFITCFHEHFDYPHGVKPGPGVQPGDRQIAYRVMLQADERGQFIRKVRRLRGF
jgi:hypothetical protein